MGACPPSLLLRSSENSREKFWYNKFGLYYHTPEYYTIITVWWYYGNSVPLLRCSAGRLVMMLSSCMCVRSSVRQFFFTMVGVLYDTPNVRPSLNEKNKQKNPPGARTSICRRYFVLGCRHRATVQVLLRPLKQTRQNKSDYLFY